MADNVTFQTTVATPPTGTVVSTEEVTTLNGGAVSAQQVQRVGAAIRTADGTAIDLPGDATNGLDVDVTRVVPGTGATNLGKAEDAVHTSGDTGVMALGVRQDTDAAFGANGDYAPMQMDALGLLKTNNQGNVAHDAVDAGNPVKVGMKAVAHGSAPTAVAAGDRTNWYANRHGVPFVMGGHPNLERLTGKYTGAQTDTVLKTVNAGQRFVVTQLSAFCDNANSVDVQALFEFDDTADVPFSEHPGIAPGSGYAEGDGSGIIAIGGDGQDVLFTCEVPTGGSIAVKVSGYLIES